MIEIYEFLFLFSLLPSPASAPLGSPYHQRNNKFIRYDVINITLTLNKLKKKEEKRQ
jgi:hypothetical protein